MNYISLFISFSLFLKVLKIKITIKIDTNLFAKYYQKNKKILQNKAHEKYQNLSEEKETRIWIQSI